MSDLLSTAASSSRRYSSRKLPKPSSRRQLSALTAGTSAPASRGHHLASSTSRSVMPLRPAPNTQQGQRSGSPQGTNTQIIRMNDPRDRPTIPKGMLHPAPPPRVRRAPGHTAFADAYTAHVRRISDTYVPSKPEDDAPGLDATKSPGIDEPALAADHNATGWAATLTDWWQKKGATETHGEESSQSKHDLEASFAIPSPKKANILSGPASPHVGSHSHEPVLLRRGDVSNLQRGNTGSGAAALVQHVGRDDLKTAATGGRAGIGAGGGKWADRLRSRR